VARKADVFGLEDVPGVTAAEAAGHDRVAHQNDNIPELVLMNNAGRSLALLTHQLYPTGKIVGIAGSGNNGGDTEIAIVALTAWGRDTKLFKTSDDVDAASLSSASVILDGILGTGSKGAPREHAARWIDAITQSRHPVVAVDWPSAFALDAEVTVTFGFPKREMLFHPNRARCGRIIAVEIGFPPLASINAQLITPMWANARLPRRSADANKGSSGRLLVAAGSSGMAGAAIIAGTAAVRAGTGLVRIVSTADNREIIQRSVPEATFFPREQFDASGITAVVLGPGTGSDARAFVDAVIRAAPEVPIVLDADGLNAFEKDPAHLIDIAKHHPLVITPHPKELSRLTGATVQDIVAEPVTHAQDLAYRLNAVVLLNGSPSVVAAPGQPIMINTTGSSDVAVAGMGDQLSGVIGAMLAAGATPREAAALGLFFAGRAADIADKGRALSPNDVSDALAHAFHDPGESTPILPFVTFDQPARH
jgi:NAD(P)H-hydrate epimerase